jgi:hypothetical protein
VSLAERLVYNIGGVVLFLLVGYSLLQFFPDLSRRKPMARLSYAYLLGIACLSGGAWALNHLVGWPLHRGLFLWMAAVLALSGAVFSMLRRNVEAPVATDPRWNVPARVVAGVAAFVAVYALAGMLSDSLTNVTKDFDGQMTWTAAARYVRGAASVDAPVLREERWYISHPRYPLLMPVSQVAVQEVFDTKADDRAFRWIYVFFYPAALCVLFDGARRRAGTLAASVVVLASALVPLTVFEESGGPSGTYGDFPLACFWGAGALLLAEPGLTRNKGFAAGLLLGAGLLTKNEGGPLALAALGAMGAILSCRWFIRRYRGRMRSLVPLSAVLLAAVAVLGAIALSVSWRTKIVNRNDEGYEDVRNVGKVLTATAKRLPLLPVPMWKEMRDREDWGDFWVIVPAAFVLGARGLWRKRAFELALILLGGFSVYLVAYGNTPWGGAELVHPTWNRFLIQLSLPGFVLLSLALEHCHKGVRGGLRSFRVLA